MHTNSVDDYIGRFPKNVQVKLTQLRRVIRETLPNGVSEVISYGIPTFRLKKNIVHFGGFAKHVSLFPGAEAMVVFADDLKGYKTSKGTIQFSLEEQLPKVLIRKIVRWRVEKVLG